MKKRVPLLSEGEGSKALGYRITIEVIDQIVAGFEGPKPLGTYPHRFHGDWHLTEKVYGWIVAVERRGSELWGLVELVDPDQWWAPMLASGIQVSCCIETEHI